MDEKTRPASGDPAARAAGKVERRAYSTPTLVEYGSVAKLTQGTGSTITETTTPKKKKSCL